MTGKRMRPTVNSKTIDRRQSSAPQSHPLFGTTRRDNALDIAVTATLLLLYLLLLVPAFRLGGSADFLALWNAGIAMATGHLSDVYPSTIPPFDMLPPEAWEQAPYMFGAQSKIYPFLYPPLWAWVMGQMTLLGNFAAVDRIAGMVNALLVPAMVLLAHRIAAPRMKRWLFLLIGMAFVLLPPVGIVALQQNQSQILVSFLTVLAIERALKGNQVTAGAALALAAAIKVYPVLLAVLFIASGRHRAAISFAVVGGALAAVSVGVAGWPLHATFLNLLSSISHSVLLTALSFNVDASVTQLLLPERLTIILGSEGSTAPEDVSGWYVMTKPWLMALAGQMAQIGALAVFGWMLHRRPGLSAEAAIWPLAMAVLTLLGPVAWGYHYMAPLAFAPMAFERFGRRWSALLMLVGAISILGLRPFARDLVWLLNGPQIVGTFGIILIAAGFALARPIWGRDPAPRPTS